MQEAIVKINNKQKNNMATKSVKKLASASDEISGLTTSRYEKGAVAFGVIEANSYELGDVISFDDVNSLKIVEARITAHTGSPVTLEVVPGTDLSAPLNLALGENVKISYVIHYIRGTGKVGAGQSQGDLLQVTLGAS